MVSSRAAAVALPVVGVVVPCVMARDAMEASDEQASPHVVSVLVKVTRSRPSSAAGRRPLYRTVMA